MKIIFLDFDGVLNSEDWFDKGLIESKEIWSNNDIDNRAVNRLNMIIAATGAKVVVSSTWRKMYSVEDLDMILRSSGFVGEIIDVTPSWRNESKNGAPTMDRTGVKRGYEIESWIEHQGGIDNFVILDDIDDMADLMDHLVLTDPNIGLTDDDANKAIEMLRK